MSASEDITPKPMPIFPVKVATLFQQGSGIAVFGTIDELGQITIDENASKKIIGTGLDLSTNELVPVCWEGRAYCNALDLPNFLGIEFDEDDTDDEDEDETEDIVIAEDDLK